MAKGKGAKPKKAAENLTKAQEEELFDQLLKDAEAEEKAGGGAPPPEDDGCCGGGGCGPKLTRADRLRLEKARRQHKEEEAERMAKEAAEATPIKDFFMSLFKITAMGAFLLGFLYLKSGAEQYATERMGDVLEMSPYHTLGIKSNAPTKEIKKAYRSLSKQWHPDRNPGCGNVCVGKMESINEAYKVLSDPAKKSAYDKGKIVIGDDIESHFSVDLTPENYDHAMASLYDLTLPVQPIVVQVYDPNDDLCQSFARPWDHVAESLGHMYIPFVRVNSRAYPELLKKLPISVKIYPTILLLERNKTTQILPLSKMREPKQFRSWIEENFGPEGMVATARKPEDLKTWMNNSCVNRKTQNLSVADDRARVVVISTSGRSSPPAVIKRTALYFSSVMDMIYINPRAIPAEWADDVESYRNSMVLLPKCGEGKTRKGVTMPLKTHSFGKASFADFYSYTSYLLSHRALPLTRKSADALCASQVMGAPKKLCALTIVDGLTGANQYNATAPNTAVTTSAFIDLYKKAAPKSDDDDSDDDLEDIQKPLVQPVYSLAGCKKEAKDDGCKCPKSRMARLVDEVAPESGYMMLDMTSGFVKPMMKATEDLDMSGLVTFSDDSASRSPCLASTTAFMNQCLVPGEATAFMSLVQYFKSYTMVEWAIFTAITCGVSFLAMSLTAAQWCLLLFVSPIAVQCYLMAQDFLAIGLSYYSEEGSGYDYEL